MNALAAEPRTSAPAGAWRAALAARFKALSARERIAVLAAGALLALALLWLLAIGPAWRTVSEAPARIEALDAQLQQMRQQAAQAQSRGRLVKGISRWGGNEGDIASRADVAGWKPFQLCDFGRGDRKFRQGGSATGP